MKEYTFSELGFYTDKDIERIREKMEGKTFMNFHISSSNFCGNHTLIIETDYNAPEAEIKNFFLAVAIAL